MFNYPVVFVDIETTGGSYRSCRIIEIALIRYENGEITEELKTLVNPGISVPAFITRLTGINDHDLYDAPYFDEIAPDVTRMLDGAVFTAHNARFDYSFVKNQLEACGFKMSPKQLCSVRLSRTLYPHQKSHKLQDIIDRHSIIVDARHRAYDDALAVYAFMQIAYEEHGKELFDQAIAKQLRHTNLPPNLPEENLDQIKDVPGVYIFENAEGTPIYIGKSVTLRKRVMSHFSQSAKVSKEMKLSVNTHNISTIETDTELEALLLESKMVKEMLPIYNRQLRRTKKQVVLIKQTSPTGYATISTALEDLSEAESLSNIYGVFNNRSKAKNALENVQKTFDLCPKLLGIENGSGPCFKYQLRKCYGACAGIESAEDYNSRFELAMARIKIAAWPYKEPIVLPISSTKGIVVDNWSVVGYIISEEDCSPHLEKTPRSFDMDTYRILRAYLAKNSTFSPLNSLTFTP